MSRTDSRPIDAPAATGKRPRDVRGFWRVLLAVIAPLPMIAKGVYYLLVPVDGGAPFDETLAAFSAHESLAANLVWLDAVFVTLLVPAVYAVVWVSRRGAPRLTTAGALVTLTGALAGVALLGGVLTTAQLTVTHDLDPAAMGELSAAIDSEPLILVSGLLFILGVVVGLGLLGGALWRSRVVPVWWGIALMAGGITHPFLPGPVAQGLGLFVAAAGFAGASLALLRMSNDEFDLPPRPAQRQVTG